jgi:hypothetical protein
VRRIPTQADYEEFDGGHCHQLWKATPEDWRCPGCGRSKFELLRWTKRTPASLAADRTPYWAWLAILQRHHDHALGAFDHGDLLLPQRFAETVICGQCNGADGIAKRLLRLPFDWSFSPAEIAQFITAQPHARHRVDSAAAARLHAMAASEDTLEIVQRALR